MTFFYDLNKKLASISDKPETKPLTESAVAEAGYSAKAARAGKDIGKPGKAFAQIAKSAGERYGSKERGEKVAGAVLAKLRAKESVAEADMDESALQAYLGKKKYGEAGMKALQKAGREGASKETMDKIRAKHDKMEEGMMDTLKQAGKAIGKAIVGPSDQELKAELQNRMYPDLEKVGKAAMKPPSTPKPMAVPNKKSDDVEEGNYFTGQLAKARASGKKEADLDGDGDMEKIRETAKPDYIDLDKDGNRKESMKKAAADAKAKKHHKEEELDEGWDDMLKDVERRHGKMKTGEKKQGHKGEIEKTDKGIKHTRRYDDKTGETDTGDDDTPKGEKRRGRPKGTGKAMGAKGPSGKSKLMTKEAIDEAIAALEEAGYSVSKLDEKAVSQQQQKFMGMVHAMQKGEKVKGASPELKKVARTMKPKDAEDFAATKHKGLPKKKSEEVEETTVAGNVAPAVDAPKKSKGGISFGKGIYDSMNRELENMISESMNISVNMSMDEHGEPHKTISVSAEGEAAEELAQLLNLAGLHGHQEQSHACPACGQEPCGCAEMVDENAPDWPTNTEVGGEDDPHLQFYAGGLNKPKETGQTTTPVVNRDPRRGSFGPAEHATDVRESQDLGMKLYHELQKFKG